jgi:hypothetical protein
LSSLNDAAGQPLMESAMETNEQCEYQELTSVQLFGLLATLPEDPSADHENSKRRCTRWRLAAPAELRFQDEVGTSVNETVDVRDISLMGVGMICKAPVPLDVQALLVLPLEDGCYKVDVKVVRCDVSPEGYRIGSQLRLPDMPVLPMIDPDAIPEDDPDITGL